MTSSKRAGRGLAAIAVLTVVLLGAIEGGLRLAYLLRNAAVDVVLLPYTAAQDWGVVPPWHDALRILDRDPVLLWKTRPGVERAYLDVYGPARVEADRIALLQRFFPRIPASLRGNPVWHVSINSRGFRDREFPRAKPARTFRVACLGDSWTFGANVNQDDAFPQRLGALLARDHPGARIEVLNLGVMGYSSRQGLELLKRDVLDLEPDFVLIGFAMNDAIVPGWRDKDAVGQDTGARHGAAPSLEWLESYKLANYWKRRLTYRPWTIGDYLEKVGRSDGTPDAVWTGREASESADYDQLETVTRVSPRDYEKNLNEMIALVRQRGAGVALLFNELWATPYRAIVEQVARAHHIPWVDSKGLIDAARQRAEQDLEARLDLRPPEGRDAGPHDPIDVIFRVDAGPRPVATSLYIAGNHPLLGKTVPNRVALHDDGTLGDQRAHDGVWSLALAFEPNTRLFYVYTNSGAQGVWEGVDVPDLRRLVVPPAGGRAPIYRAIETFGAFPFQADGWHTNAAGLALIAQAIADVLNGDDRLRAFLSRSQG